MFRYAPQVAGFAALGQDAVLLQHSSHGAAFGYQLAAIAVTVAIAVVSGGAAGWFVSIVNLADQNLTPAQLFDDGTYWTVRQFRDPHFLKPGFTDSMSSLWRQNAQV